jgi:hypothetical protein
LWYTVCKSQRERRGNRLRVFENGVLSKTFRPEEEEVRGNWRKQSK